MTWKTDSWWASSFNDMEAFRKQLKLPSKIAIHDATLRDGEQTPGVVLSVEEKVEIAKMLDRMGVDRIEAGMPAVSESDREAIRRISSLGLNAKIFAFSRATTEDIDMAADCGADGVIIEIPVSEPKLTYQFPKWTKDDVAQRSVTTLKHAKEKGLEAVYFGYDTTRADFSFLKELYAYIIREAKPDSIGIVDTMGCILPGAMKALITELKSLFDMKFEIHTHNDFGMATAISFAAMEAGAEVIHTCINGMGERTGNASLEEIIMGLKILYGMDVPYDVCLLNETSKATRAYTNFSVPVNKPVIGENIFLRESGIGIDMVLNQPLAMFAVKPSLLGKKGGVVLGKKSGAISVKIKAEALNVPLREEEIPLILEKVKERSIVTKTTVDDGCFLDIIHNIRESRTAE